MKAFFTPFFLLFLLLIAAPQRAAAQVPEVEPNNSLANANQMAYAATITGALNCVVSDGDDYFRVALPPGTKSLRIITKSRMQTSGTGGVYYYLYNKFGQQLTNYYQSFGTAWTTDTLDYPCFEGDTFFVRIYQWTGGCKEYEITTGTPAVFQAGADPEVNDAFGTATPVAFNFDTSGHLANMKYASAGAPTDGDDYYRVVPPTGNRGLRVVSRWRAATPGGTGGAYYYLYNKYQQQLASRYVSFGNTWVADTLDYPCFEGDTFYVRMYNWSGDCKEYRFRTTSPNVFSVSADIENNDNFATATPIPFGVDSAGHLDNQKYGAATAVNDIEDYYRIVPPATNRGLRLVTRWRAPYPGQTGGVYVYLYNKYQQQLTNQYISFGNTWVADTLDYPCFEGDTFYVRMYNWSGDCKEYTYNAGTSNFFATVYDVEPNDNFATAFPLAFNTDTTGHIDNQRYGATGAYSDGDDYFRVVAPAGNQSLRVLTQWRSVTPGSSGGVYVYLYNKAQQQLTNNYVPFGNAWVTDTLDYPCFAGDTFYVRCYNWTGACKEYRMRTTTTGLFTFAGDAEPNNTRQTATPLAFRTNTTGTLDNQIYGPTGIYSDGDDYYQVVMPNNDRGIRVRVSSRMVTPGTSGGYYLYIYNKAGSQLANKYIPLTNTLKEDTLDFPCFNSDTFYVRLYNWTGSCKEYSLRTEYANNGPIFSAFERTRFGSSFSFVNRSRNATSYLWTFGDGTQDTTAYLVHTYGPGVFPVRLRATGFCGTMDSRDTIQVEGIEYYTPKASGSDNGYGVFNIRVFGAGLDTNAEVRLTKGGAVLRPTKRYSPSTKELTASFNLTDVDTGFYDVSIRLSNNQTFTYQRGYEIFADSPGVGITTTLNGPTSVRTGANTNYTVVVRNKKSRMANGVMVFIAVPEGVETNIRDILKRRTGVVRVQGEGYNELTIPMEFYNKVYYGGSFNPETDVIEHDLGALYQAFDSMVSIKVDRLLGQDYRGTLYPILIPFIPARGTHTISFKVKTPANGAYPMMSFAWPFTLRQNPMSGESLDFIHDAGMNAASLAELAPNPALRAVGKSAGYVDIGSKILFAEAVDWWYGTNVADEAFYAEQGVSTIGELGGELLPTGSNINAARATIKESKEQIARRCKNVMMDFELLETSSPYYRRQLQENLIELSKRLAESEGMLSRAQKSEIVNSIIHLLAKKGINMTTQEINERLFPEDVNRRTTNSVTSLDPNAIYGNTGPKAAQYLRRDDALSYLVTFENVDTALAPAAIVRVETQLDTTKFDLRRAYLGNVTIGDKSYLVEPDRREYFRDIDLRPAQNLIVRVNARIDTTGRAYWEFTSLDPATMDLPEDPTVGFLPPNVTKPQGEGSVQFFAHLKPGLSTGDSFSAQAAIYFDFNDPIQTNKWMNTVDETRPSISVSPTIFLTSDSVMTLSLAGDDAHAGLERYAVFMKVDTGAWQMRPYYFFAGQDARITGAPGHTYSFYAVARDSVGNAQFKPQVAEASITIPAKFVGPMGDGLTVYPNPARNAVMVSLGAAEAGPLEVSFTMASGSRALVWTGDHPGGRAAYSVPLGTLVPGVYFVQAAVGGSVVGEARLVVVP